MAGTLNVGGGRVVKVTVKTLSSMSITEEREAFQRELKAHIHAVRHCDGICKLYDTYEWGHRLRLVMKMYEDGSLDKRSEMDLLMLTRSTATPMRSGSK